MCFLCLENQYTFFASCLFHLKHIGSFQVVVNHTGEIDEIFDAISYRKGASVIRMLQSYLGAECFQVGPLFFNNI